MRSRSKVRSKVPFVLLAVVAIACTKPNPPAHPPVASTSNAPRVVFPDGFAINVEIAADDDTRQQGLMFRDRMAEDRGMLFFFMSQGEYAFWMKNTLIPLDMIWIDAQHKVVHVAHDVQPCKADPCPSVPPNAPATYVLETAAGVAAKHRVGVGAVVRFEGLDQVVVR